MRQFESSLERLAHYCHTADYKGWDLFDGLNARLLQATPLYRFNLVRLAWIQLFKRSPINFRRIAGVPMGSNAKGIALFVSGFTEQRNLAQAEILLARLATMRCEGFHGESWGYNFDWEARAFFVKKGTPNLVTTVFVANAYLDYYDVSKEEKYLNTANEACKFLLHDLIMTEDESELCFRYIPGENAVVHNAYMLGAALLGRVFRHTQNARYLEASTKAMRKAIRALRTDWSWPYGELPHHQFVDNFHTGFNLVSLSQWIQDTGSQTWKTELRNAYNYWLKTFFLDTGCPKYYADSLYPIDIHCSAQGIVTCLKLQALDDSGLDWAGRIGSWAIENMQDKGGYFYYKKTRFVKNKIPYIRWSQAWMFYALSLLISQRTTSSSPRMIATERNEGGAYESI